MQSIQNQAYRNDQAPSGSQAASGGIGSVSYSQQDFPRTASQQVPLHQPGQVISEIENELNELSDALNGIEAGLEITQRNLAPIKRLSGPDSKGGGQASPDEILSPLGDVIRRLRKKAQTLANAAHALGRDLAI